VTTKEDQNIRVLRIPVTVLQSAKRAETPLAPSRVESVLVERGDKASMDKSRDQDRGKGQWSRTRRTKGATPACKVNWGTVMRMPS